MKLYGAIEAGGTKMICSIANDSFDILESITIETETPEITMPKIRAFFEGKAIASIGIACFGPVDIKVESPTYGHILNTPKIAWQRFDFLGALKETLTVPMFLETDVNVAAYGELHYGKAKGKNSCIYITIGTGVGGGYASNKGFLSTMLHSEMGHIPMKRLADDTFAGSCPFHGDCLEGLVSGSAIGKRMGVKGHTIASDDPVWETVAYYIAQAAVSFTLTTSPEQIILGGGVMQQEQLLPLIHQSFIEQMAGYIDLADFGVKIDEYIVYSGIANDAAIVGAIALAKTISA